MRPMVRYAGMAVAMAWRLASGLGDMLRGEAARIDLGVAAASP